MEKLERSLGYQFNNQALLAEALIHPSLSHEAKQGLSDNQRLEFLGDAVLQLVLTECLYNLFPHFTEGKLTKLRARLVSRVALQQYSLSIDLGLFIAMSKGEEASGGRDRASTLADAFESVLGAIYLDGGLEVARNFLLRICKKWIDQVTESPDDRNPKGQLQEKLQAIAKEAPQYKVISESGPDHDKSFTVCVMWQGKSLGEGSGNSKKMAEVVAAQSAIEKAIWKSFRVKKS